MPVRYLVRLSANDKTIHAFDPNQAGKAVWRAECGDSVPVIEIRAATQQTPTCIPCLITFGTAEADRQDGLRRGRQ
jgi:hypothetical protein